MTSLSPKTQVIYQFLNASPNSRFTQMRKTLTMQNSKIGWTHHTWNPWWGCNKISEACRYCYIGPIMRRSGNEPFLGPIKTKTTWRTPYTLNRKAYQSGERYRIFTCSMSDFFHPGADQWRAEAWKVIKECEHLDWLILTKRPELIKDRLPADWGKGYSNVWLGVTVENQDHVQRIDQLTKIPAAVRFVSAEPLLGPIKFGRRLRKIDWVITGCEKAAKSKRREMQMDWVRSIRDQCDASGTALFHKQYFAGTQIVLDGVIDGEVRQEWPRTAA
jgi:protein gp37